MTREKARELLPIIQAYSEGKTIQYRVSPPFSRIDKRDTSYLKEWIDLDEDRCDGFSCDETINYRIKPGQKYRPFKSQEECWQEMLKHQPFGWLKSKKDGRLRCIGEVSWSDVFETVNITLATEPNTEYSCVYIFKHYIFSDGTPFGIKEE